MTVFLFADNARSTLATGIGPAAVSVTVAPGDGAKFPNPGVGQQFALTLNDQSTRLQYEVVYCTARSVDVLTIVRGQEGTTPQTWVIGDYCWNGPTSGQMEALLQTVHMTDRSIAPQFLSTVVDGVLDVTGAVSTSSTLTTGGAIAANSGNIVAFAGRLRAGFGATGSGDSNAATILGDFPALLTQPAVQYLPSGLRMQFWWSVVGGASGVSTTTHATLPIAFPTAHLWSSVCYGASTTPGTPPGITLNPGISACPLSPSQVELVVGPAINTTYGVVIMSVGY